VLISGEPGIGKSRLAAAIAERIAGEAHTRSNQKPDTLMQECISQS
jgi:MoxR-like ATPase